MSSHAGLFVQSTSDGTKGLMPIDGRLILGAVHGTTLGVYSGGGITLSASDMTATIAAGVWRIPDPSNSGAVFQSVTDQYGFTIQTAPSTGSRVDLIEIKQDDPGNGDSDPYAVINYVVGTGSTAPSVDAGCQALYTITVSSTSTVASKCVVSTLVADAQERSQRLFTYDSPWTGAYTGNDGYKWHDVNGVTFNLSRSANVLVTMGVRGSGAGQGGMFLDIDNAAQEVFLASPQNNGISNAFSTATLQLAAGTHTVDVYNAHWGAFNGVTGVITVNGTAMTRFAHIDLLS